MSARRWSRGRGFSLIEAVIIVVMISIAVPPSIRMMTEASSQRADRVLLAVGTTSAQAIADQIMADVSKGGLDVLADASVYLDTPGTGLWDRMSWVMTPYEDRNLTASVTISSLVDWQGAVSADANDNMFRVVTIEVGVPTANGAILAVPVTLMLGEPNP